MKSLMISRDNPEYLIYGKKLVEDIVKENLRSNGGTLLFDNVMPYSDYIILAYEEKPILDNIMGFLAIRKYPPQVYINQIAVKIEHKRKGIGTFLLSQLKEYEKDKDIICNVRSFNTASQKLFEGAGFIKDDERGSSDNYFYKYESLLKQRRL